MSEPETLAEVLARDVPSDPPAGYRLIPFIGAFSHVFGAIYARPDSGRLLIGFRCSARHLNPNDLCHGGVVASFADLQAYGAEHELEYRFSIQPTVSLTVDYLDAIAPGAWVEGSTTILRRTNRLIFTTMTGQVDGRPMFHARGIYRIRAVGTDEDLQGKVPRLV